MIYKFDESDLFITLFGFEKHVQSQIECCWIDRSRSCTPEIYLYFNPEIYIYYIFDKITYIYISGGTGEIAMCVKAHGEPVAGA